MSKGDRVQKRDREREMQRWKRKENMCEFILQNANERVPVLWIVFHTLIGRNILCVTFETECKWYVRQNRNSCPNKIRLKLQSSFSFCSWIGISLRLVCLGIYFENYLSRFWYRMLEYLPSRYRSHSHTLYEIRLNYYLSMFTTESSSRASIPCVPFDLFDWDGKISHSNFF